MGHSVKCAKLLGGQLPKTRVLMSPGLLPLKLGVVAEEKHFGFIPSFIDSIEYIIQSFLLIWGLQAF